METVQNYGSKVLLFKLRQARLYLHINYSGFVFPNHTVKRGYSSDSGSRCCRGLNRGMLACSRRSRYSC